MGIPAQRVGNSVVAAKFMRMLSHHHEIALCSTRNGRARGVLVPPTVATSATTPSSPGFRRPPDPCIEV